MFSGKKLAVASMLMGGLALSGLGAAQAHAEGPRVHCAFDAQANLVCSRKSSTTYTSDDGTYHLQQTQDCSTVAPLPGDQPRRVVAVGRPGTTKVGATVGCSNNAPAPDGFVAPSVPR
ncbi:hypothetical protein AB0436_23525 [Streptomyces sp. NPDC051322]|uniref:hypothetical protein n=1 Tax=Streptomyces sp. NPDC051322 TaxID=3154645 RepID=UPI00344F242D